MKDGAFINVIKQSVFPIRIAEEAYYVIQVFCGRAQRSALLLTYFGLLKRRSWQQPVAALLIAIVEHDLPRFCTKAILLGKDAEDTTQIATFEAITDFISDASNAPKDAKKVSQVVEDLSQAAELSYDEFEFLVIMAATQNNVGGLKGLFVTDTKFLQGQHPELPVLIAAHRGYAGELATTKASTGVSNY